MAYEVPDLPYDYNALEPHIDEQTMRIHHDKHHQAYVDKANAALEGTEWADKPVEEVLANLSSLPVRQAGPGAQQRRRPRQPLAVLDDPRPERRRHAQRRPGCRDRQRLRRRSTRSSSRWSTPASTGSAPAGHGSCVDNGAAGRHQLGQPGLADHRRPDAAARHRRVGARVLPEVPEQAARLPGRDLERDRLVGRRRALRQRARPRRQRSDPPACGGGRPMRPPPLSRFGGGLSERKDRGLLPGGRLRADQQLRRHRRAAARARPPRRVHHRGVVRRHAGRARLRGAR